MEDPNNNNDINYVIQDEGYLMANFISPFTGEPAANYTNPDELLETSPSDELTAYEFQWTTDFDLTPENYEETFLVFDIPCKLLPIESITPLARGSDTQYFASDDLGVESILTIKNRTREDILNDGKKHEIAVNINTGNYSEKLGVTCQGNLIIDALRIKFWVLAPVESIGEDQEGKDLYLANSILVMPQDVESAYLARFPFQFENIKIVPFGRKRLLSQGGREKLAVDTLLIERTPDGEGLFIESMNLWCQYYVHTIVLEIPDQSPIS